MIKILNFTCNILIISLLIGCSKSQNSSNKFIGSWHVKGATVNGVYDTVTFADNGRLQDKFNNTLTSYSIISSDTIAINTSLSFTTHRSYYVFYSENELHINFFEPDPAGFGYDSIALIKN